jgi:branched-chain amino acid transport system ATP-binding protein
MTLLETRGVRKAFAGLQALDSPDVAVDRGEVVGLIGPNGAGKTTFFNCLTGVLEPDEGEVRFDGEDVVGEEPYAIAERGMVRTFQQPRALEAMTVAENVRLGAADHPGERPWHALTWSAPLTEREAEVDRRARDVMTFLDIDHVADDYASTLSGGQQKLLALARALMTEPELLLLDEPFAGVNPTLEREIVERIVELNEQGMTLFIVEHELENLVEAVDRLIVLHDGKLLAEGTPDAVLSDDRVVDAYLGESMTPD